MARDRPYRHRCLATATNAAVLALMTLSSCSVQGSPPDTAPSPDTGSDTDPDESSLLTGCVLPVHLELPNSPLVRAGANFSMCAISTDGELTCWGNADFPWQELVGPFVDLALADGVCALRLDGSLACASYEEVIHRAGPFAAIDSSSGSAVCALDMDGRLSCWSLNDEAQVAWLQDLPSGRYCDLNVGYHGGCATTETEEADCWGALLDAASTAHFGSYRAFEAESAVTAVWIAYSGAMAVNATGQSTFFPHDADWSWTEGSPLDPDVPKRQVRSEGSSSCAIRLDRTITCSGDPNLVPPWHDVPSESRDWIAEVPPGQFTDVAPSPFSACGVTVDGRIECWGEAGYGETAFPGW